MATISITIPDAVLPRVIDALCIDGGYERLSNPRPTKPQFARGHIAGYVRRVVIQVESQQAAQLAREVADAKAESEIVIS